MIEREQKPERHLADETINNRRQPTVTHDTVLDTGRRFTEAAERLSDGRLTSGSGTQSTGD
jgi:hypothetical protein